MSDNFQPATKKMFEYMEKGLSIEEAMALVKPGKEITDRQKLNISKNFDRYSLTNPKRIKKASLAIDKTLNGKAIGEAKPPNHSDILKAAEMVLDRAQPKITLNHNINENISLSPVDLDKYKVIDVDCE